MRNMFRSYIILYNGNSCRRMYNGVYSRRRDVVILCGGINANTAGDAMRLAGSVRSFAKHARTFNTSLQTSDLIDHSTCENNIIITRNESK